MRNGVRGAEWGGEAKPRLGLVLQEISRLAATILSEWAAPQKKLPPFAKAHPQAVADIE